MTRAGANGGSGSNKPHVLAVPFPSQGHMLPFLDLVTLLAARGLSITVAVTAGNAALVDPLVEAYRSAVGAVVLPFPPSPLLPARCGENTKDLPASHLIRPFMVALAALRAPLLAWCRAQGRCHVVTAVVSDFFTGWTQPLAAELGVPHVVFSPSSAFYLSMTGHLWRHLPRRRCDADDEQEIISFPEIPGSPSFPWRHLSSLFRKHVPGDEVSESIRQFFLWSQDSACVVINTFAALEAAYLQTTPQRMLAVGPLSEAVGLAHVDDRGGKPAVPAAELTGWLDAHAEGSVLRGAPVPEGFETAATRARGLVIHGWAPQARVLRHRAVGWFLTHCGWNSVLEAAAAGVALLTWPVGADQFTDAWQVAEAGVAVPVAEGADDLPDAAEVAKAIDAAMGSEGNHVRERAAELSRKAAAAVAEGGSSHRDLEELVCILTTVV
ncbi:hypothetical protein PR202_ga02591 [Eleusine coracana subsp. coracana]|uniref:Glycosyltransferase N-terminal domain-containing protein n=1 Tax=Eleusine coracana subsp. coracana TaxID=191504 RepID=A0AAV5BKI1_ELECO|nr:hypothetical protein PR202_ga02591 [Eleusine coracana subsp. coracana]